LPKDKIFLKIQWIKGHYFDVGYLSLRQWMTIWHRLLMI